MCFLETRQRRTANPVRRGPCGIEEIAGPSSSCAHPLHGRQAVRRTSDKTPFTEASPVCLRVLPCCFVMNRGPKLKTSILPQRTARNYNTGTNKQLANHVTGIRRIDPRDSASVTAARFQE